MVVIDDFSGRVGELIDIAARWRIPFPPSNYYTGLRRVLTRRTPPLMIRRRDVLTSRSTSPERSTCPASSCSRRVFDGHARSGHVGPAAARAALRHYRSKHFAVLHYLHVAPAPGPHSTGSARRTSNA